MFFWNSLAFSMIQLLLLLSRFSRVQLCATPETAAHQAPPSLGFSRQEHWSGLPFPSPMHESEKWKWKVKVKLLSCCFSAFSKSSLYIWKFSVHVLLKPSWKDFEHYLASMWNECSKVIWTSFGIAFLWDWNEDWPFPVLWPLLSFPNLLAYGVQHFHNINLDFK